VTARRKQAAAAYDVVIVGGGMVGSLAACALGDSPLKVAVIEPRPTQEPRGAGYDLRVSALTLATKTMFESVGAWPGIVERRFAPVRAMRVWQRPSPSFPIDESRQRTDSSSPSGDVQGRTKIAGDRMSGAIRGRGVREVTAGLMDAICEIGGVMRSRPHAGEGGEPSAQARDFFNSELEFNAAEIGEPCLAYIVENSVIVAALRERLEQFTNVHIVDGAVTDFAFDQLAEIALSDNRRMSARLVVGADGAESAVRKRMETPVRKFDMNQVGIVATVRTERPHDDVARQVFLSTGPLAFLPLPEPHTCSIVWSADRARANALAALDDGKFVAELASAFGGRLGVIETVSARAAFPLALAHADRYVGHRTALIGDAAHTVHPLAGQGANLGFLDAATLAEVVLAAASERRDIGAEHVLRRYERWRKGDNLAMIAVTGGFKLLFGNDWPMVAGLRGAGFSVTDRIAPVKNLIMRRASGLVGDLPAIARRAGGAA
jgi:2-octaprenylphenol hydroxylase